MTSKGQHKLAAYSIRNLKITVKIFQQTNIRAHNHGINNNNRLTMKSQEASHEDKKIKDTIEPMNLLLKFNEKRTVVEEVV